MTDDAGTIRPEEEYRAFLEQGRFMLLRGRASGRFMFYPRVAEPGTGATDLEWVEASGEGTVYSTTTIGQKPPKEPYNVALIDLKEGPRMMSRVDGIASADVRIGMPVKARVIRENDTPLLVFEPA
ncbi:Zn-ribbon domain-containing OB-fold protein [Minwuia sp.]|uniref:Zn-ribbon domain-containing OB-fold protein n=1 Tax=Minwuia sp. TaxID=2493630 RepID=UPI003A9033DB